MSSERSAWVLELFGAENHQPSSGTHSTNGWRGLVIPRDAMGLFRDFHLVDEDRGRAEKQLIYAREVRQVSTGALWC
ncbi:uncharacterized protein YALI1_F00960g [Yarrowia lipolytica]|uniref:Uncharacterized protein n=1 Tax=Yarrowia lipolytica TaxID=4952 RepID=A0A1D8NLD7_YARLL|nr:hypothetical protein YALI1_F00960g [Yarrowia lipolytica]